MGAQLITGVNHNNTVAHAVSHLVPFPFKCLFLSCKVQVETQQDNKLDCNLWEKPPDPRSRAQGDRSLTNGLAASGMTEMLLCQSRQTCGAELLASKYLNLKLFFHSSERHEYCSLDTNLSVKRCLHKAY